MREGLAAEHILVTGNTGIDALLWVSHRLDARAELGARAKAVLGDGFAGEIEGKRLVLMTGHRRESFDGGLARIASAIGRLALRPDVAIVFPVHPNPNVRRAFAPLAGRRNILLVEPVDYPELVYLLKRCHFVVTDSGGIQEEAPSSGNPCWSRARRPNGPRRWSWVWRGSSAPTSSASTMRCPPCSTSRKRIGG